MNTQTMIMEFKGTVSPDKGEQGFSSVVADGLLINSIVDSEAKISKATLTSRLFAKDGSFWEAGRIEFPEAESSLYFDTRTPGSMEVIGEGTSRGTISWYVTEGTGVFTGLKGIITGNFTANGEGAFVDHQVIKLTN